MGAIRWEQDQYDGDLVDIWVGWLGLVNICLVKYLETGVWHLRMYDSFPGARNGWTTVAASHEAARKIADDHIAAWLNLRALQPIATLRSEADFRGADIDVNGYVTFREGGVA